MFEKLLSVFSQSATYKTPLPEADANHAFGALMVRVAKADKAYLFEELERIDQVLAKRVGLNSVQAAKFRAECEKLEEVMPETEALGKILANGVSEEDREAMFSDMWEVLMADGLRHHSEEKVVNDVAEIFALSSERAMVLAKNALE